MKRIRYKRFLFLLLWFGVDLKGEEVDDSWSTYEEKGL